ncbi:SDR family NAD(P)-dependent oxidoreductase [Sagittula sp. S175]|uniref:SDR family NAD(P)-dependent oxidoreductase n=1 Tax=Sagittula sp. S175 TaxID=3415129 RepID=UPI003C7ED66D
MDQLKLDRKRVVVTGAAGGLGRAFAAAFVEAGAHVLVADVNAAGVAETAEMLGENCRSAVVDVTDFDSCAALAAEAGACDVLVNNAALYAGLPRGPFEEIDEAVWDRVMRVNIKGVWQMCRAFSPLLRKSSGAIVNVASATVLSGSPQWMHYVASKGAVIAMTRVMAKEMGPDGVRVNALAPGFTLTEASLDHIDNAKEYGADRAALKRSAEVADIVGGALFLASGLASFTTGQTLVVDGGKQFI